jgi:hypothetical protein
MLSLYRQGTTLHAIGLMYGLTRERVRQILSAHFGVTRNDGGAATKHRLRLSVTDSKKDQLYRDKYGCGYEEYKAIPVTVRLAWRCQKRTARYRGIPYRISVLDFWRIWQASGKWGQFGRGKDKYCLTRLGDQGSYEVGNVVVMTNAENGRLYGISKRGKKMRPVAEQGVCCLFPGWKKPWVAYLNRQRLGYFATEEDARAARKAAVEELAA